MTERTTIEDLWTAQWVQEYRRLAEWSQKDLADNSGVSERTIQRIEKAERTASADTLKALAAAFQRHLGRDLGPEDLRCEPPSWAAAREQVKRTYQTVRVSALPSGHALVDVLRGSHALMFDVLGAGYDELDEGARAAVDAFHGTVSDSAEILGDLDVWGQQGVAVDLDRLLIDLKAVGLKIVGAQQRGHMRLPSPADPTPFPWATAHVYVCQLDSEPAAVLVRRQGQVRL